jgi:hypothetical protein
MKVLIAAPLRQDPKIFTEYQRGLDSLIIPEGAEVDRYFVVNDCDEVIPYIRGAKIDVVNNQNAMAYQNHLWTGELVSAMSVYRNMTIRETLDGGYDYLLSVDTDLVLEEHTLMQLIEDAKDCVAGMFWTNGWSNCWMYDQVSENNLPEWQTPGLYRVGGTGALFLIKRKVLEAGVDYTPIPNLRKAVFGEDRHFCIRAVCNGFELWADNRCQPVHLYRNKQYDDYIGGRYKPCFRK